MDQILVVKQLVNQAMERVMTAIFTTGLAIRGSIISKIPATDNPAAAINWPAPATSR